MRIEKSPLPRKLLIFTVSARFFTNCTFTIPWSVLETFILERKAWAFAKWRKSIIVQPSDAFLKTPYRSLQNSVYSCFFKVFCVVSLRGGAEQDGKAESGPGEASSRWSANVSTELSLSASAQSQQLITEWILYPCSF